MLMPDKNKHLQIVKHNYKTLSHLVNPSCSEYTDWCTVIIFYMALHYVHMYLAEKHNNHPTNHLTTQKQINDVKNLKPLYYKYRNLQDNANDARYNGAQFSIHEMRNSTLKWFRDIQESVFSLINVQEEKYNLHSIFEDG